MSSRLIQSVVVVLTLLAGLPLASAGQIYGTALIRERITLPPGAEFEAQILDASSPGGPELRLAVTRKVPAGRSPIPFAIDYDSSQVQPGQRYIVRVTVSLNGQVRYAAEPPVPVRLDDTDSPLQIALVAVGGAMLPGGGPGIGPVAPVIPVPALALPAQLFGRYAGDLPGANGAVRWELELMSGGQYRLRQTPLNRRDRKRFDETGRWTWERDRQRLVLSGGREGPIYLEPAGNGALRRLDRQGRRIDSGHNDLLLR